MGYCQNCKWWGRDEEQECSKVGEACKTEQVGPDGFAIYAGALDDSGLVVQLRTGPFFGCQKFEQKKGKVRS